MSVLTEVTRILTARNTIRTKLINLGLVLSTANIDTCAEAINNIENRGNVTTTVKEGETYTIPKGYHNGSGTVSGIKGGGNYSLLSKVVTPTKAQQNITPDDGYYGLSDITVEAIPTNYLDVSSVTATSEDVLANKTIVTSTGEPVAGTMINNGAISGTIIGLLDTLTSYIIPKGFTLGGVVTLTSDIEDALKAI